MDISSFLARVSAVILNPLIILVFAIAFLIFVIGIFQFISVAGESADRDKAKSKIWYGIIGMFIMFSAYGLIHIILGTFGIPQSQSYIQF